MKRKTIRVLHLLLGLISGVVVFVVAVTGCLLVFEEEISRAFNYGTYRSVARDGASIAPPSKLFSNTDSLLASREIKRAYSITYLQDELLSTVWSLDRAGQYHATPLHPQTGQSIGAFDYPHSFFAIVLDLHMHLALGEVGASIVGYATAIFVLLMITGLLLWKPANRKGYKQRFRIKWNASGKRLTYDLHNVLGFYMSWVAIFIAITGLVWSFAWVDQPLQWLANGGKTIAYTEREYRSDTMGYETVLLQEQRRQLVMDSLFATHLQAAHRINALEVHRPMSAVAPLYIAVQTKRGANYARTDYYSYDSYTGKLLGQELFADMSNGEKLRRLNYYIHMGSIAGLTGKLAAFFASLIAASLPITGLLIYINRGKRKRKP